MMSPTLLEAAIVVVLIILGWQIGIGVVPEVLRYWRSAQRQLEQIEQIDDRQREQTAPIGQPPSLGKEDKNDKATRPEQTDRITYV